MDCDVYFYCCTSRNHGSAEMHCSGHYFSPHAPGALRKPFRTSVHSVRWTRRGVTGIACTFRLQRKTLWGKYRGDPLLSPPVRGDGGLGCPTAYLVWTGHVEPVEISSSTIPEAPKQVWSHRRSPPW